MFFYLFSTVLNAVHLHCREFLDHVNDEVIGHLLQMLQNLDGTNHEIGLVVLDAPLLAEALDELVTLGKVVTGHHGEQVVIDLILEAAAEPIDEELGEAMAADDVAGGGNLELPEVGSGGRHRRWPCRCGRGQRRGRGRDRRSRWR